MGSIDNIKGQRLARLVPTKDEASSKPAFRRDRVDPILAPLAWLACAVFGAVTWVAIAHYVVSQF
jgi:hypothetical protein